MKLFMMFLALSLQLGSLVMAGEPAKPTRADKCPVCGMFVAKYPDFLAQVGFKDGSYAVFDGAKDMFKYYYSVQKYTPSKTVADIDSIYVTDYYTLEPIDAIKAYYVVGSNVFGPMGKELIPFQKQSDADEFMVDHVGKSRLEFKEVTQDLIKSLD